MPNQLIKVCDHCSHYYVSWPSRETYRWNRPSGSMYCGRYCYLEAMEPLRFHWTKELGFVGMDHPIVKKEMTWLRIREQQVIVCRLMKIVTELLLVRALGLTQCEDSEAEKFLRKASRALLEQLDWLLQLQRTWSMAA